MVDRYSTFFANRDIAAAADALKAGYKPLYEVNELVHDAKPADLKGTIVQVTGADHDSRTVALTVGVRSIRVASPLARSIAG